MVAIVSILVLVALPGYREYVRKSRRAEAITLLNQVAQQQERWRANNTAYTTDLSASGIAVSNPTSGNYTLGVTNATATGYVATASAAGTQATDARCVSFSLTVSAGNISYGSSGTAASAQCWSR